MVQEVSSGVVNAAQLRAARVWLAMSQDQVATAAGLTRHTIMRLERDTSAAEQRTLRDICKVFETRGIRFLFSDGVGVGISTLG
ncbi:helix-turn-helix transcriptional regulator [Bradyrhizobium mercantei]|uniref:helix-turn-helix transcriptional regulator n=1 Tax=Bradyrhizobium mercantei TaxID=1904807 RepID=UPI0009F8822E